MRSDVAGDLLHAVGDQQDSRARRPVIVAGCCARIVLAAARVEPRRRLVQDEHLRARMAITPAMATRRFCPPESSKGDLSQHVLASGRPSSAASRTRAVDLVVVQAHVFRAEGDVLIHRLLKELILRVLEHQPHLEAHVADLRVGSAQMSRALETGSCPAVGLQQAVEVLDQRGLAGARVADDAEKLPRRAIDRLTPSSGAARKGRPVAVGMASGPRSSIGIQWLTSLPLRQTRDQTAAAHSSTVMAHPAARP